jgi:dTDP-4-dehydrorhamnose 3,5-epimerase
MSQLSIVPVQDAPSVYADGTPRRRLIEGINLKRLLPVEDHRGHIVEMFNPAWALTDKPVAYVYQVTLRVGSVRGWVVHRAQEDRIFISRGTLQWALYDNRPESPTYQLLNVLTFSEENRAVFVIPPGVYHAVKCIGEKEAVFINMPSAPYNHDSPDKYRLPLKNDLIPFDFSQTPPR